MEIFASNILSIKDTLYLTVANIIGPEIVNKNDYLDNKAKLGRIAWQTTFTERERSLKPMHPPLACLAK